MTRRVISVFLPNFGFTLLFSNYGDPPLTAIFPVRRSLEIFPHGFTTGEP
jgi:hypothetical protein